MIASSGVASIASSGVASIASSGVASWIASSGSSSLEIGDNNPPMDSEGKLSTDISHCSTSP
ncbi:MAG: hypothetical protein LBH96_00190 [Candidatus Peribacteria bacterium]|nr:hypothetical protein [Candidatus Peribacteria bacterium]